jgi:hypothetical protein
VKRQRERKVKISAFAWKNKADESEADADEILERKSSEKISLVFFLEKK